MFALPAAVATIFEYACVRKKSPLLGLVAGGDGVHCNPSCNLVPCSACGNVCPGYWDGVATCTKSTCGFTPGGSYVLCGDGYIDTLSDPENCG